MREFFAEFTANEWILVIGAVGIVLTNVVREFRATKREKLTRENLEDVKSTLQHNNSDTETKFRRLEKTADATHVLVNSRMGNILARHARLARRMADKTKDPADIKDADEAEKLSKEHNERQAIADGNAQ